MHDVTLLSAKLLLATVVSGLLASADFFLAQLEIAPDALTQYGLPGLICAILFYAVRCLYQINQKIQSDWMIDRKQAESDRLADRDKFFSKLEEHFESSLETRQQLIKVGKDQIDALKGLSGDIKKCIPPKE